MQKTSNMFCLFCQYLFSNKGGSNIHSHQPSTVPRTKNAGGKECTQIRFILAEYKKMPFRPDGSYILQFSQRTGRPFCFQA